VFENRGFSKIFGPKRYEVTGGWRKLHNEELHNSYSSGNTIRTITSRRMRWARHVALKRKMKNKYKIFVGKSKEKKLLGRPRSKWEDNIKMKLWEIVLQMFQDLISNK
jgi:hypothetical protein